MTREPGVGSMALRPRSSLAAGLVGLLMVCTIILIGMPNGHAQRGKYATEVSIEQGPVTQVHRRRSFRSDAGYPAGLAMGSAFVPPHFDRPFVTYSPAYPAFGPYSAPDPAVFSCKRRFRSRDAALPSHLSFDEFRRHCR